MNDVNESDCTKLSTQFIHIRITIAAYYEYSGIHMWKYRCNTTMECSLRIYIHGGKEELSNMIKHHRDKEMKKIATERFF